MFWSCFFADTEHMPEEAAKAHLFLIGHAWLRGARLPDDDGVLARLCRIGPRKWAAIKKVVLALWFKDEQGLWTQKRMLREFEFVKGKVDANRRNGTMGGRPKTAVSSRRAAEAPANFQSSQRMEMSGEKPFEINETAKPNGCPEITYPTPTPTPTVIGSSLRSDPKGSETSSDSPILPKMGVPQPELFDQPTEAMIEPPIDLKAVRAAKAAEAQRLIDEKAAEFYRAYPKHVDPRDAKKTFTKTVKSGVDPDHIIASAIRFSARHKRLGTDKQFIPAPAVWLNKGSYDNDDLTTTRRLITADELWTPA